MGTGTGSLYESSGERMEEVLAEAQEMSIYDSKEVSKTPERRREKGRIWNYLIWGSISWPFLLQDGIRNGRKKVVEYFSGVRKNV